MWRSKISDRAWVRASAGVLPADMPLLAYRLAMMLTGKCTTALSRWRTQGIAQMPRSKLPELKSTRL